MKKVVLMLVVALSVVTASAQIKLGVNGGLQVPTEKDAKTLLGGGISGEYFLAQNISAGLNFGYYFHSESGASVYLMPVTLGGKYYFLNEDIKVYGGLDLGLYTLGFKTPKISIGGIDFPSTSVSDSYFGLAPVVGLQFKLTDTLALDVNTKYNLIFSDGDSTGFIGFNVGIVYTLK